MTPYQRLARRAAENGAAPFVTWYGTDGSRIDLSATTFANAVAKLAGLLDSELEVTPGGSLLLDIPSHWQLSVWLAAGDALGMDIQSNEIGGTEADIVATINPECELPGEKVLVPISPMGLPGPQAPAGFVDQAREAMGQPDVFPDLGEAGRLRYQQHWLADANLVSTCQELAKTAGLATGGRLVISGESADLMLAAYALPLVIDASVVILEDPETDVSAESVSARL